MIARDGWRSTAETAPARSLRSLAPPRLTIEGIAWIILAALALLTRFWDLSTRAQHHDESLHAYYSWLFYVGDGYVHNPLMHGPTLFHTNAFAYLLFGANDYTSRVWPAALGATLVLLPALLRGPNLLGRWGALAASTLLLFSPTLLYQTRNLRHDPLVLVMTAVIAIAALRYLEKPAPKWTITIAVMAGLLFATMETSFIVAFILVTFVAIIALWQANKRALFLLGGTGVAVLAVIKMMHAIGAPATPAIPWEHPTSANIRAFAIDFAKHPTVLAVIGVVILGIVLTLNALDRKRDRSQPTWWESVFASTPRGSTAWTFAQLTADRRTLGIAVGCGLALFVVFFTTLFTNMFGLGSGTVGALGYWLGQHDVQRGDQPWFYYLLMLPQYEYVGLFCLLIGAALTAWRLLPKIWRNQPVERRDYMRGFFIYWAVLYLAILSWAGEKMPWLTVHIALPLALLAGSLIGEALEKLERSLRARDLPRWTVWLVAAGVPVVGGIWFALWAWGTAGAWETRENFLQRTLRPEIADRIWLLYLPPLAMLALLIFAFVWLGRRRAGAIVMLSLVGLLLATQIHTALRLSYQDGDTPIDMYVYVQSSPDVTRTLTELGEFSRQTTGGLHLPIAYDNGTSWPMQWYLRDYDQRRYFGDTLSSAPSEPIVLISNETLNNGNNVDMLAGYTYTEYAMRWWFPEDETYRRFAIAPELNELERQNYQNDKQPPFSAVDVLRSVGHSLWGMREPQQQAKMFRLVAYRELWAPIGSYNFRVYVRNDLLPIWNSVRYQ